MEVKTIYKMPYAIWQWFKGKGLAGETVRIPSQAKELRPELRVVERSEEENREREGGKRGVVVIG